MSSIVIKTVCAIIGLFALTLGLFVYPDKSGKLHNKLDKIRLELGYRSLRSADNWLPLFSKIAGITSTIFDDIFGEEVLSLRFVASSTIFSATSGFIVFFLFGGHSLTLLLLACLSFLVSLGICGNPPVISPVLPFSCGVGFVLLSYLSLLVRFGQHQVSVLNDMMVSTESAAVASIIVDMLAVSLIRRSILSLKRRPSRLALSFVVVFQVAVLALFVVGPYEVVKHGHTTEVELIVILFQAMNAYTLLIAFFFWFVLLVCLLNQVAWGWLSRLIYPLWKFEIVRNRTSLFLIAGLSGLVVFTPGSAWTTIKQLIIKKLGG
jgi:hypothetical protein